MSKDCVKRIWKEPGAELVKRNIYWKYGNGGQIDSQIECDILAISRLKIHISRIKWPCEQTIMVLDSIIENLRRLTDFADFKIVYLGEPEIRSDPSNTIDWAWIHKDNDMYKNYPKLSLKLPLYDRLNSPRTDKAELLMLFDLTCLINGIRAFNVWTKQLQMPLIEAEQNKSAELQEWYELLNGWFRFTEHNEIKEKTIN